MRESWHGNQTGKGAAWDAKRKSCGIACNAGETTKEAGLTEHGASASKYHRAGGCNRKTARFHGLLSGRAQAVC